VLCQLLSKAVKEKEVRTTSGIHSVPNQVVLFQAVLRVIMQEAASSLVKDACSHTGTVQSTILYHTGIIPVYKLHFKGKFKVLNWQT
jgi:hypothetical protein